MKDSWFRLSNAPPPCFLVYCPVLVQHHLLKKCPFSFSCHVDLSKISWIYENSEPLWEIEWKDKLLIICSFHDISKTPFTCVDLVLSLVLLIYVLVFYQCHALLITLKIIKSWSEFMCISWLLQACFLAPLTLHINV